VTGSPTLLALIAVSSFVLAYVGASVGLVLGPPRLPLLLWYLGPGPLAPAANGLISGAGALAGAVRHLRDGRVSWPCLLLMGGPSVLGAVAAAVLFARHVPPPAAQAVIGVVLLLSGLSLLAPEKPAGQGRPSVVLEVAFGFALGALTAATGLMLGSLRLPVMMRLLNLDPKVAAGTNMAIGCATVLTGAAVSLLTADVRWPALGVVLLAVVPPTVVGGWLGARLTARASKDTVRRMAGWLIAASGVPLIVGAVLG
jgi:uncharacterized membrane protein YfcA